MGFIYKITNTVTGKSYVGQTKRDIQTRWKEHIRDTYYDKVDYVSHLHNSIKKYGEVCFVVEELEECEDSLLNERETYWIKRLGTLEDGYNIAPGGQGSSKYYAEDILMLWEKGYACGYIANNLGISKQTVIKQLKRNGVSKFEIMSRGNKVASRSRRRKVIRISSDGKEYVVYDSLTEASKNNGLPVSRICMVCSGERNYSGGYRWMYWDGEPLPKQFDPVKTRFTEVCQYSLDGEYIQTFDSVASAAREIGRYSTGIFNCCSGRSFSAYGYRWSYSNRI